MTHLLSKKHYEQFMRQIAIARFTMANGQDGKECTLLIKAPTLLLRFLIKHKKFKVLAAKITGYPLLWYAVRVEDDPDKPFSLWSIVEDEDELIALQTFFEEKHCYIFLFNEGTINVTWCEVEFETNTHSPQDLFDKSKFLLAIDSDKVQEIAHRFSDELHKSYFTIPHLAATPSKDWNWHEIRNDYISESADVSSLKILSDIEGNQQEQLAFWIVDSISPRGAFVSPKIDKKKRRREFVDVLLSYELGCFLFESKALSIYERADTPDRAKLSRAVAREVRKAASQLGGAVDALRDNTSIYDSKGAELEIVRDAPHHCIIVVPDLTLLDSEREFGSPFLEKFLNEKNALLQIMDPPELLSAIFSTNRVQKRSKNLSRAHIFDYVLQKRWLSAIKHPTCYFRHHVVYADDEIPEGDHVRINDEKN